ncbi:T6SS effector amidase Tae4 family protein [Helicobacter sp. MIT 05-5294]|uniref:T6SS effector amidase Tae4 family protein n=1 Tax=Helicobacter sp. MIT 05-5294 TaxID=1548150 RepID=UPI00051F9F1A|nr:T6SS effector amidase Tae4 family protein [Helicobacter sp. MIT 05-5294]TLD83762.1 hypothetical protein LS69_010015 [Helicobacter sp. MIT 05-5294]
MPIEWEVRCGNKKASIKIQRPSFESVKKAYEEITRVGSKEFIGEYWEVIKQYQANIITESEAQERVKKLYINMSGARYKAVSDRLFNFFNEDRNKRYNTCATRVSYAINNTAIPLAKEENQNSPNNAWIINNSYYGISVDGIIEILSTIWHKPKIYDQAIKQSILCGCSEDFYHTMNSKKQNKALFEEFKSFKRKGIVAMRLQGNRIRHTTLWEEDDFVDVKMNKESSVENLYGYDYLNDPENTHPLVSEFYFWEVK